VRAPGPSKVAANLARLQQQIMNMDVATPARHVRAATPPQISWEPIWNVPLAIEGSPDPGSWSWG